MSTLFPALLVPAVPGTITSPGATFVARAGTITSLGAASVAHAGTIASHVMPVIALSVSTAKAGIGNDLATLKLKVEVLLSQPGLEIHNLFLQISCLYCIRVGSV